MADFVLKQRAENDDEILARQAFRVGMTLYGYCCGYFGRDSYGDKVIILMGPDWIKVRECIAHGSAIERTGVIDSWADLLSASNEALEEEGISL